MDMDALPAFMGELRTKETITAKLVEFVILTACRSIEAREAVWSEIDLIAGVWTIPKERMKAGREHMVPLSERALEILKELEITRHNELVFPHPNSLKALSVNAPRALLKRIGRDETLHGFRATFKSWATDRTTTQREVIEMALAHKIGNDVEASYLRTSAMEKRKQLMEAWSGFSAPKNKNNVIALGL